MNKKRSSNKFLGKLQINISRHKLEITCRRYTNKNDKKKKNTKINKTKNK